MRLVKLRNCYDKTPFLNWAAQSAIGRPFHDRYPVYIYDTIFEGIYV